MDKNKGLSLTDKLKEKIIQQMINNNSQVAKDGFVNFNTIESRDRKKLTNFEEFNDYKQIQVQKNAGETLKISNPFFRKHDGIPTSITQIDGKEYINFASYNYLGLNGHPQVSEAAKKAIDCYGTSVSGSRITSGERQIHQDLETELAKIHGAESSIVFVSGHATNVTTIGYLFGPKDLILYDSLCHNSIIQGILLSGAKRKQFQHNSWHEADKFLEEERDKFEKVLIIIEGLYSMDGDYPNLPEFIKIKKKHAAFIMIDEAHSLGVLGQNGRGITEHVNVNSADIDICMGTLSKALAGAGGYITGCKALIEMLRTYAPGFFYSVGISPPVAAASLSALEIMQKEPARVKRLHYNGQLFLKTAQEHDLDTGLSMGYSVIPIIIGNSIKAARLANRLFEKGIVTQPIFYPAVEEKSARLRFFLSSEHTEEQIVTTIKTIANEIKHI